jgi:predicted ester cyclase
MGAAPSMPHRQLTSTEKENIKRFQTKIKMTTQEYDNLTAFGNVVVAIGPPQHKRETTKRMVEMYQVTNESLKLVKSNEFTTNPSYSGDQSADTKISRKIVESFYQEILTEHKMGSLTKIVSPDVLIHPTAMPCEASYYGINGVSNWLETQWKSFPDLTITDYFTVAQGDIVATHWNARGTSKGNFLMLPPSGNLVEYDGSSMYRVENGQISEIWETRNTLAIMGQLNPEMRKGNHSH